MQGTGVYVFGLTMAIAGPLCAAPSFLPANDCALCHSRPGVLTRFTSHFNAWKSSMMSAAARDPYWRARVSAEVAAAPDPAARARIEDKCLRCHAAADQYGYRGENKLMRVADLTGLGREGVTCTVCHRIEADGLGKLESFTGGFQIAASPVLFGPHEKPFTMPMQHHTGMEPVASRHILEPSFCATCHNLFVAGPEGRSDFPEQATHLEWLASSYPERGVNCITCHVPPIRDAGGSVASDYIAQRPPGGAFPPTNPRSPVGLHSFTGGNVQMLETLAGLEPDRGFRERAEATRRFLGGAAKLEVSAASSQDEVRLNIRVHNLTGHKLPSGLPVRRMWLHVIARDAGGRVVFESGGWNPDTGELRHERSFQPHYQSVTSADQAMIYETVLENAGGDISNLFTQAVRYRKDNRLLPAGFGKAANSLPPPLTLAVIAPVGTTGDPDFQAGGDSVEYRFPAGGRRGRLQIAVEVCFQSIGPRDSQGLTQHRAPVVIARTEVVHGR